MEIIDEKQKTELNVPIAEEPKKDPKALKGVDDIPQWYKNPVWIQSFVLFGIFVAYVVMNWVNISKGMSDMMTNLTNLRLVDLFAFTFITSLVGMAYFFLVTIWTGGITNKLLYAKLFKKRLMPYLSEDNIMDFYIPKTDKKGWWRVKNVGEFKTNHAATFWFANGTIGGLTVEGFAELINIRQIKDRVILKIDPNVFEKRNDIARLEGMEAAQSPWKNVDLMSLLPLILIVGIVGYLIILGLQSNECQANLINLAKSCGETAKVIANNTAPMSNENAIKQGITTIMK